MIFFRFLGLIFSTLKNWKTSTAVTTRFAPVPESAARCACTRDERSNKNKTLESFDAEKLSDLFLWAGGAGDGDSPVTYANKNEVGKSW